MSLRERPSCRSRFLRILVVLGLIATAGSAAGQSGIWQTAGPEGGTIRCLAPDPFNPSTVYAGTDKGVFRSDDGGSTWRPARAGMPLERVATIAIDPAHTATLYAGTLTPDGVASVGIFKSIDGGTSWTPINDGLEDPITGVAPLDVEALAIDSSAPDTLLAGTRFSDIFRSDDGGATWQFVTLGGFNVALETSAFQFDPADPTTVFAAGTQGLVVSVDSGMNWSAYGDAGVSFSTLAFDPVTPTTLYAGNNSGFGMFKSTDLGANWTQVNTNLPVSQTSASNWPLVISLLVDPSNPSTLYAGTYADGLFKSVDGAATWAPAVSGMRSAYVAALAYAPTGSSTLLAGTLGGGVYRSLDAAATWTPESSGLELGQISAIVADPAASGTLYAGAFDGVHRSENGGSSWQAVNNGLPVDPVSTLVLVPGSPARLFAGTLGGGVLVSADGGDHWTTSAQGLTDSFISSIAADPANASILYAGTSDPAASSERVFKSTDGGATWTQTSLDAKTSFIDSLVVNPANPSQVAAVSHGATSYFQSVDGGKSWSSVTPDSSCGGVNAVLFSPAGPTTYLGGSAGVCRSTDGGKTWALSTVADSASVEALLLDPTNPSILYAGASPVIDGGTGGVFLSADGGQTWNPVGNGLSNASVTSLALDAAGQAIHAGIFGGGVADLSFAPPERLPVQPPSSTGRHTRDLTPR